MAHDLVLCGWKNLPSQNNETYREKIRRGRLEAADSFHLSLSDEDRMGQAELGIAAQ